MWKGTIAARAGEQRTFRDRGQGGLERCFTIWRKLYGYWHVILPGSKRRIRGSSMFGDNTDVGPPQPDELWKGGVVGAGGGRRPLGPLKSITLALDGTLTPEYNIQSGDR